MTEQQLSLREALEEIATGVRPVDLSERVARRAKILRRRRAAAGGVAAAGAAGASVFAVSLVGGQHDVGLQPGGVPEPAVSPSNVGWFAYTPLPGSTPLATTTPSPSFTVTSTSPLPAEGKPCTTFDDFSPGSTPHMTVTDTQAARAKAMGTTLCARVGGGPKYDLEEWISEGGLSGGYAGLTFNIQAHVHGAGAGNPTEQGEIWIAVHKGAPAPGATHVTVSAVDGSLQSVWPDGTTVHLEAGKDTPANRAIIANPVFDAFRS